MQKISFDNIENRIYQLTGPSWSVFHQKLTLIKRSSRAYNIHTTYIFSTEQKCIGNITGDPDEMQCRYRYKVLYNDMSMGLRHVSWMSANIHYSRARVPCLLCPCNWYVGMFAMPLQFVCWHVCYANAISMWHVCYAHAIGILACLLCQCNWYVGMFAMPMQLVCWHVCYAHAIGMLVCLLCHCNWYVGMFAMPMQLVCWYVCYAHAIGMLACLLCPCNWPHTQWAAYSILLLPGLLPDGCRNICC